MALRVRADGRILCAAMHPEEPGDTYLHDGLSYRLTVELSVVVTEPMFSTAGRGGHAKHGEWWWKDDVPADVVLEGHPADHHGIGPPPWTIGGRPLACSTETKP